MHGSGRARAPFLSSPREFRARPPPFLHGRRAPVYSGPGPRPLLAIMCTRCTVCYYGSRSSRVPTRPISRPIGRREKKRRRRRRKKSATLFTSRATTDVVLNGCSAPSPAKSVFRVTRLEILVRFSWPRPNGVSFLFIALVYRISGR